VAQQPLTTAHYFEIREYLSGSGTSVFHKLLGHSDPVQGDVGSMQMDCEFATTDVQLGGPRRQDASSAKELEARAKDWCLLLQYQ
jgi:hypothetical protein